jgi:hypothetical protein
MAPWLRERLLVSASSNSRDIQCLDETLLDYEERELVMPLESVIPGRLPVGSVLAFAFVT